MKTDYTKNTIYWLFAVHCSLLLILFSSCQKVINLNLNSTAPVLVVVGTVTDQPGPPYTINLTQTVNFDQDNTFPVVTGALVTIADNVGNLEVLKYTSNGNYVSSILQGTPGRTYTLSVTSNGKNYSAVSTMPPPVTIDTLVVDTTNSGFFTIGGGGSKTKHYSVIASVKDPAGIANYYRFVEQVNGITKSNIYIVSDAFQDGQTITRRIAAGDTTIHTGDTITVSLQSVDKNVYEYFRTLNETLEQASGIQVASPANPETNLSNSALGYFNACAVRSKRVIVP